MTKPSIAVACWFCWLAIVLGSPLSSLRAEPVATEGGSTSFLARLPIGFRMVDRDEPERSATATRKTTEGLPLAPRARTSTPAASGSPPTAGRAIATVVSSLAVVGGLLVVVTWFARRYRPTSQGLPGEVFQYLGTTNIAGRQAIHVMKFGDKMLLVSAGPTGLQPLAELTSAEEVQRLTSLCRPTSSNPIASTFQRVVSDWSRESSQTRLPARPARSSGAGPVTSTRMGEASHA